MKRAVIDIETVPVELIVDMGEDERKRQSLDALSARVACIGIIVLQDFSPVAACAFCDTSEHALLANFWDYMRTEKINRLVAHNGLSFDLPFIWRRSVVAGIEPSINFDLRKFRTEPIYDTMAVWGNWEPRGSVSLDRLATALSVGSKNSDGSQVATKWLNNQFGDICKYCINDCWLTYGCFCRMNFVEPARFDCTELRIVGDVCLAPSVAVGAPVS